MPKGNGKKEEKKTRRSHLRQMVSTLRREIRVAYTTQELMELAETHSPMYPVTRKTMIDDLENCDLLTQVGYGGKGGRWFWLVPSAEQKETFDREKKAMKYDRLKHLLEEVEDEA